MRYNRKLVAAYKRLLPNWAEHILAECEGATSIMDIGCGPNSVIQFSPCKFRMGIDIYQPYLDAAFLKHTHDIYVQGDITKLAAKPKNPKSFDVVLASEVLEHLDKHDGLALLARMEQWAIHKVIIKVPNGYIAQPAFDGNQYQAHRSAWYEDELKELGYTVTGMSGWKPLRGTRGAARIWPYFIGDRISDMTQPLVLHRPRFAFQLFGVKHIS